MGYFHSQDSVLIILTDSFHGNSLTSLRALMRGLKGSNLALLTPLWLVSSNHARFNRMFWTWRHSRPQRPRFFRSAPGITTSGSFWTRKSANHGLLARMRNLSNLKQLVPVNGYQNRPPRRLRVFRIQPEVVILGADGENRGLWEREWLEEIWVRVILRKGTEIRNMVRRLFC